MTRPRNRLASNVLWNWSSHILNIAVGFFILRFLIGRLGAEAFGSWVLLQTISTNLLFGVGRHRYLCLLHGSEGAANLALSVLLAPHYGLVGVALGTAVPMLVCKLFFLPRYVCGFLRIPLGSYLLRILLVPAAWALALGGLQRMLYSLWPHLPLAALAAMAFASSAVLAALAWAIYLSPSERRFLRSCLQSRQVANPNQS